MRVITSDKVNWNGKVGTLNIDTMLKFSTDDNTSKKGIIVESTKTGNRLHFSKFKSHVEKGETTHFEYLADEGDYTINFQVD